MSTRMHSELNRVEVPAPWQFRLSELMLLVTFLGVVMPFTWRMAGYFTNYHQDRGVTIASLAIFLILYGPIMSTMLGTLFSRSVAVRMLFFGFLSAGWGLSYLVMMTVHCLQ